MHLFKSLVIGGVRLPNRIALTALPSGQASLDGFVDTAVSHYYIERARGGVGLLVMEAARPLPVPVGQPHIGLYNDTQVLGLRSCIAAIHAAGAAALVLIDQHVAVGQPENVPLGPLCQAWIEAAWRAHAAGADGVMLNASLPSPFGQLLSAIHNRRTDGYSGDLPGRLRLLLVVVEELRRRFGVRMLIAVRLPVGEFVPGGLPLHDARVAAKRLSAAGVGLIEISAEVPANATIAQFPGWLVPLAAKLRSVVDIPVMVGGLLGDAILANDAIREGSADIVALGPTLRDNPRWPEQARTHLQLMDD
jgi:NADPH2 dehydrogenase